MQNFMQDIRKDFPALSQQINEKSLIYFDNAATTHKPKQVIDALTTYYEKFNANPHRGAHYLSIKSTEIYEDARETVRKFIHAKSSKEIIFTKNATESLNILAFSYAMNLVEEGDEIVVSILEHHSNLLPWQQVAKLKGATLKFLYLNKDGGIKDTEIESKITKKTKLVSITHMSNALGNINPIEKITTYAHQYGAKVILDGAQSVPHMTIDVGKLGIDFMVFSGHKMLAPMGIGVLYGKEALLKEMKPFLFGGNMIEYVYEDYASFAELPFKLEAGTQNVEGALGLMTAINYINEIGMEKIQAIEADLTSYALEKLTNLDEVVLYGSKNSKDRGAVISFNIKDVHPHDTASILDSYGVAVRAGHHCAQPLMRYLEIPATTRASFSFYNTKEEIDFFVESLKKVRRWLGYGS